jgi:carbonic anhydrase
MKNITNQDFVDELCGEMPDLPTENLTQQGDDINKYISKRFKYYKYKGALIVCPK